jgi:hypothetical protein
MCAIGTRNSPIQIDKWACADDIPLDYIAGNSGGDQFTFPGECLSILNKEKHAFKSSAKEYLPFHVPSLAKT